MSFLSCEPVRRRRIAQAGWLAVVACLAFGAAIFLRNVLTPVILALLIAYIANPLLTWLERHRVRRWLATTVLYSLALAFLVLFVALLGPKIWSQARRLYQSVSVLAQDYGPSVLGTEAESEKSRARQEETFRHERTSENTDRKTESPAPIGKEAPEWVRQVRDFFQGHAAEIASRVAGLTVAVARNAARGLSNVAQFVLGLVLVLVFTFFFMLNFHKMIETAKRYIPAAGRERTFRIAGRVDDALSNFFRGRLLVCVIAGTIYVTGLRLSGIEFWLLLGVVGGILSFIPVLGVILPLIPACAFALLTGGPWASLLGVVVTFSLVQWVVEPVAATFVLSHRVRMHPITIILALLIGGSLFGVLGVLLSIPLAAVFRILGEEFVLPPLRELAEGEK